MSNEKIYPHLFFPQTPARKHYNLQLELVSRMKLTLLYESVHVMI